MKFSHTKLELVRQNPGLAKDLLSKKDEHFNFSMNRAWVYAARKYHQAEKNKSVAFDYFENSVENNFKMNKVNIQKKTNLLIKLDNYFESYNQLEHEFYDYSNRITIDIQHGNIISGEIFRYDKTPNNGYAITLMDRENSIWANQLRFPLFQIHFSNVFKCPIDLIKVGTYNFEEEKHEYITYDEDTLRQAESEIRFISNEINKIQL